MKQLILSFLAFALSGAAMAQFVKFEIEEVPNSGKVPGKTYRVYAVLENQGDVIDAIFSDEKNEVVIQSTAPFYQHPLGGILSSDVQRFDAQNDPKLMYDSWFTIGAVDNYRNYVMPFAIDSAAIKSFEQGKAYRAGNSAWFVTPDQAQGKAGSDKRILLMQLTTAGKVTGTINIHGRKRAIRDQSNTVIGGGEVFEQRGLTFTCG